MHNCHYFKSNKAKRTKAMKKLVKGVRHVIFMSGTPALNRPVELYNAMYMIDRDIVPEWPEFIQRYCAARMTRFGLDVRGASNINELREKILNKIMLRRLKKDVLKDLPDKLFSVVPMEMTSTTEYAAALLEFKKWQDEMQRLKELGDPRAMAEALVRIEKLKQICLEGKLPEVIQWIKDMLEANGKLVVFTIHKEAMEEIVDWFEDDYGVVHVDGSVTGAARQAAVDKFQEDEDVQLFVGNIKAAGVGITLTAASHVAFVELPWTPGELDQATDRLHRIGQHDSVNVYYLVAEDTIEEDIVALLDKKRKILDQLIDGKQTQEGSLLGDLMNCIRKGVKAA